MRTLVKKILEGENVRELIDRVNESLDQDYELVDFFRYKALFTPSKVRSLPDEILGEPIYVYELTKSDDPEKPGELRHRVFDDLFGSIIILKSMKTPLAVKDRFKRTGTRMSLEQFVRDYADTY